MRLISILLALCGLCSAQVPTPMGHATLTRALHGPPGLPGDSNDAVFLSSTACVAPPGLPTSPGSIDTPIPPHALSLLFIDLEAFRVNFVDSTTKVRVERAVEGTSLAAHAAGTFVWCGPASYFGINDPGGACTIYLIPVQPLVVIPSGQVWCCTNSRWTGCSSPTNSGGATLSFGSIQDGDVLTQTFTLNGAVAGDRILPGWPATLEPGVVGMMRIVSANTVSVSVSNWSGATIAMAPQFFQAIVGSGNAPVAAALTFPTIADGDIAVRTFALPGAIAGSVVIPGFPASLEAGLFGSMRIVSTGLVEVRLANASGGPITPAAAQVFRASVGAVMPVGTGSGALTYGAISDGDIAAQSFTVTGAIAGTMTQPGWPPALETGLTGTMLVPSLNLVQSRILNLAGASVTPATETFSANTF